MSQKTWVLTCIVFCIGIYMLIMCTSRKQNCSMRTNVTKVTAAYAISRTTRKVADFGIWEDKTFFFSLHTDFPLKLQHIDTLALRAQMFIVEIPKEQNPWYLLTPTSSHLRRNICSIVFTVGHIYVFGVVNWLPTRIFRCLIRKRQDKILCRKMFKLYLQATQTRI